MTRLETILRAQRGRYLWGVRSGEGSLLSWHVGDPHLHVEMGRTPDGVDQRFAEARGHWQVEILDGQLRIATPVGAATLDGDAAAPESVGALLAHFEGQALVSFELGEALALRFDLEAEFVLGGRRAWVRVSGPEGEAEWKPS